MAYRLDLPDGSFVTVQDDAKPRAAALAEAKAKFPDAFPAPPGIGEQLLGLPGEIGKGFVRGLTVDPASGLASLGYTGARAAGADMVPFEQTGVGQTLASAQKALAPSDEGLITQFGGGLGSLLSFIPGGLLKGGIGLATKLTQAGGVGSEEARARAEEARVLGEADATAGQQFLAQLGGTGVGLTELAPLKFLTDPIEQILRGTPKSLADVIAPTLFNSGKRMLVTGGIEGFQEGMANIAQDLIAKGIYNPNLEVGESALGDAAMGASVGAFAQGSIDLVTRGKRRQLYEQVKQQEELAKQAEEQRIAAEQQAALMAQERQKQQQAMQALGAAPQIDPETGQPILLLGGPAPKVNLEDPLGVRFGAEDLSPKIISGINRARKEKGLPPTQQFTIEDLVEAGSEKDAPFVSEMLARKIGFDPSVQVSPQSIFDLALSKNIDVENPGFADFLRRTTGSPDVASMSPPQLFAAQQSLSALPTFTETTQLPTGSGATVFNEKTYQKTIDGLKRTVLNAGPIGRSQVLEEVKGFSGLTETRDAERLLETALKRGDLGSSPTQGLVGTSINISLPAIPGVAGPDVRRGDYMDSEVTGYEITSEDGKFKQVRPTMAAAETLLETAQQNRQNTIDKITDELGRTQMVLESNQEKLADLQLVGQENTPQYKKIEANVKNLTSKIDRLNEKVQSASQPLQIKSKQTPRSRAGFTLFENGQPVGTYPTQEDAQIAAVRFRTDEELDGIINAAPRTGMEGALEQPFGEQPIQRGTVKGGMPRRLVDEAVKEKDRRYRAQAGLPPPAAPIKIKITGDAQAAAERLRASGITVRFMPEVEKEIPEINKKLRAVLDKLGLKDIRLNIVDSLKVPGFAIYDSGGELKAFLKKVAPGSSQYNKTMATLDQARAQGLRVEEAVASANGSYAAKLIEIALDAENPIRAARHEAIHALKELGFFTPQQWAVLERKAKSEWIKKYKIKGRYSDLDAEGQIEEAIADAFSDFDQEKPPTGQIGILFNKVKKFFEALGNALRGSGFQTASDVFTLVEDGRLTGAAPGVPGKRFSLQEPRIMGTGKIVGAPPGRNTEADREALINEMVQLLEDPFTMFNESRFWYENSGQTIREMTRSDPALMERVVRLLSLYSQANSLGGNTTATIKSIAQLAQGQPTALAGRFPNETAKRIPAILSAPTMDSTLPGVDDKLMNFYRNLRDATFQDDTFADASTVDRWMMRLFGYPHAEDQEIGGATGVSNTQYIYAKDLLQRIANIESERTGETILPRQIQAALWTYVRNKTEFDSLPPEKQATFEPKNIDFADYVTRATANITWESRPSTKINLIPGIHKAPRDDQEAFNRAVRNIFVDPNTGEDKIFKLLDNQQLYSSEFSMGAYENLITPNIITRLVLQKDDGEYLTSVADNYAAIVGYVTKQDAVPWYRADPTATGKDASVGYRVTPSVASTPEFENRLFEYLNEKMPGVGFTRIGGSFDFVNYRDADGKPFFMADKKYIEKLQDALRMFASDVDFNVVPFRAKSGWISNDWKENSDGQGYLDRLRNAGLGDLQRVIDGWSKDYDQIANDFGREFGWSKFSLKSDESIGGPGIGSGISIRPQQPTAQSFDAVHYGKQRVNTLVGSMYGTGIKGAEARRVFSAPDPRIRQRAYFYIPFENGRMPKPEAGLGQEVHVQRLNNLLGPGPEMQALASAARIEGQFDENAFESSVIDAGYDGYAVPSMGMAVVLDANVPVQPRGTRQEVEAKPEKDKIQIGDRKYSLRPIETKEFKQWFGDSKIVNADSTPKVMYHGTAREISEFRPKQANAIFVTDDPNFAESFTEASESFMADELFDSLSGKEKVDITNQAREIAEKEGTNIEDERLNVLKNLLPSRANIMPLYVRAENPFDYENTSNINALSNTESGQNLYPEELEQIALGRWSMIEKPHVQRAIKEAGFDSFYVKEGGRKNLAVYDPNQIKSAVGNFGTFSRTNDDIRYSLALGSLDSRTPLIPDEGGNPDGNLGNAPEKFGGKPIRMLIGTHNDITDKGYGANHVLARVLNDPRRMADLDMSVQEVLERILVTAQKTSQSFSRIYRDPKTNSLVFYTPKNSLILAEDRDQFSVVTMFREDQPERKFGKPLWEGRAPVVPQFVGKIRGTEVEAKEGRVKPKAEVKVSTKRVYTPSDIAAIAAGEPTKEPTKGTLSLGKKLSLAGDFQPVDTESANFKRFFGDSKAVNQDGSPMVLYHGTTADFDKFKVGKEGGALGNGLYFSPSREFADEYAREEGGNVVPVYVSIQNPLIIDGSISRDPMTEALVRLGVDRNKAENIVEKAYEDKGYITNEVKSRATKAGFDGIFQYKEGELSEVVAFNPTQVKSSIGNVGTFDLADPRIQYSLALPSAVEPSGGRDNMIFLLQDKNIDLKRVQQGIVKAGKDILDRFNAYMKEELFHGRSATRVKFFMDKELRPLLQKMEAANISVEQMDDYLLARHAKEANAYIRKVNPDPKQNSGMTDKEAEDYMASLPPPRRAALEKIAKEIDGITKGTRQLMVEYGLEDQKTINQWEKTYKNYVPLFREEVEDGMPISIGRGYQIRGSTTRQRMGSTRKVADILANIALQRERTIVRGEKNRVGNALYGLVLDNPDKGFWAVINPEKMSKQAMRQELLDLGINPDAVDDMVGRPIKKVVNKTTGLVSYEVPPMWKNAENLFITRINGEDRVIGFNKDNERSMRMATTLKNLDAQQQGEAIRMMGTAGDYYRKSIDGVGKVTRYFAQINTQYNPAFGIYNLMRDIGGAVLNLQTTPLKGQEAKVISDALVALKSVYRDLRRQRDGLDADSKWAQIFEEFELEGGKTGYRDLFETRESRAEALQKEIQDFNKGNFRSKGKAIMGWLSDFNDAIENSVRVSVYKNALDKGISKERAASLAKNITVNFNRTGAVSRNFQTLFAFFNASIQGTARIAETLLTKEGRLSPTGKRIVMGGITLGLLQAVLLAMAGLDDDEVPDFVKDKSFVIPYGDGKYFAIPMPLGYNIIPGFGRRVMEFAMSEDKNVGKAVAETSGMIIDGFNPLGSATFVQTLTPTVLDPIVALAENKDFTGKPISREDVNSLNPTPGYTRGSQNSFAITEALAYGINILTGGTEFKKGVLSPTPDQIEYLVGEALGGVGREAMKIGRGIESIATGEELATYNVPIIGRLTGNIQQQAAQRSRFFENVRRLNEHQAEIEGRLLKGEDISEYIEQYPEASLYQASDKIYNRITKLRQMKKALEGAGADREQMKVIDETILGLMASLNQIYSSAKE
jgi:hypothetical protein